MYQNKLSTPLLLNLGFSLGFCFLGAPQAHGAKAKKSATETPKAAAAAAPATPATSAENENVDTKQRGMKDFNAADVWKEDTFSRDDHKVLVIQDRKYTKTGRFELGLQGGKTNSSPFYKSTTYGMGGAYHFNEYFGIDGFATLHKNTLTEDGKQVNRFLQEYNFPTSKEFQEPKLYTGGGLIWSPIYGKFAFFRKSIIHFDVYSTIGLAYLKTKSNLTGAQGGTNQGHLGSLFSIGTRIFLSKNFSTRLEVKNTIYRTKFAPLRTGQNGSTLTRAQYQYTAGIYYFFGTAK